MRSNVARGRILRHLEGRRKGLVELDSFFGELLLPELLMGDLERPALLDGAIQGVALGAVEALSSLRIDLLEGRGSLEILEVGTTEESQVFPLCRLIEQDGRARFADDLKDTDGMLEETPVEDGQYQSNVSIVTDTVYLTKAASLAASRLGWYAQTSVEHTALHGRLARGVDVVELTSGAFQFRYIDNILLGEDSELDMLDLLWSIVNDEVLHCERSSPMAAARETGGVSFVECDRRCEASVGGGSWLTPATAGDAIEALIRGSRVGTDGRGANDESQDKSRRGHKDTKRLQAERRTREPQEPSEWAYRCYPRSICCFPFFSDHHLHLVLRRPIMSAYDNHQRLRSKAVRQLQKKKFDEAITTVSQGAVSMLEAKE